MENEGEGEVAQPVALARARFARKGANGGNLQARPPVQVHASTSPLRSRLMVSPIDSVEMLGWRRNCLSSRGGTTTGPERRTPNFSVFHSGIAIMKTALSFWLCLLPLLAFPGGASSDEGAKDVFSRASCDFSINLLKSQSKLTEGNTILSPASVGILLTVLQQGARENTLEQLRTVLRMTAEQSKAGQSLVLTSLKREKANVTLEWATRAYIRRGFEVADAFNASIRESLGATIEEIDFAEPSPGDAAAAINKWIEEVTSGNIRDFVPSSALTPDTTLLLLSAVYFKGLWDVPFKKQLTRTDRFETSPDGSVSAPFMSQEERFLAGEDPESGILWLDLPFKDEQFSMLFVLPSERHGLSQVLDKMNGTLLRKIIDDDQTRLVTVSIPKFKLQEKVFLAKPLQELGLRDVFTAEANLEGLTPNFKHLSVSKVLHEAAVEIDESGSTASAATGFALEVLSFPKNDDHLTFKADHPFFFFILDRYNKIPLFAGIVVSPT